MDERARRISQAIEKSGLSYPELEKMTGISKSSLQRYATGVTKKIPIDCIEKIAEATQTSARYLMGWDDDSIESGTIEGGQNLPSQCMEQDPDIRRIERAKKRMDSETQKRMMTVITSAFSEFFNDDYNEDDVDE